MTQPDPGGMSSGEFPFRVSAGRSSGTEGIFITNGPVWVLENYQAYPVSAAAYDTTITEYDYSTSGAPPIIAATGNPMDASDRTVNFIPCDLTDDLYGVYLYCVLDPFVAIGTRPTIEDFYIDVIPHTSAVDVPNERYYRLITGIGEGFFPEINQDVHGLIFARMDSITAGFTPGEPVGSGYATITFQSA